MEFTKREYQQFYHGISMSLLSKKSAQKWRYDDETAEEIRFLEGLESKVLDKIKQADTPQTKQSDSEYYLELADAVMRGEISDAEANQAWYEYINHKDEPQTERRE